MIIFYFKETVKRLILFMHQMVSMFENVRLGSVRILMIFERSLLCLQRMHLFDKKYLEILL